MAEAVLIHLPVGVLFHGRYRVVRRIKSGGMGAVYEVVDAHLERARALKVMLPEMVVDRAMCARFELEAKATAQVHSEHVVETIDYGVDPETGAPFLVMELLDGEDLETVLERRGPLPPAEVVGWLRQVALGLDRVHAADVVHRDLKPGNVFLTLHDDGSSRIKLIDFGIAKRVVRTADRPETTRAMGTPAYMSPEQIRGDGSIGPRADLYALGHIAFTLLAGKPYWSREERDGGMWLLAGKVVLGLPEPATARGLSLGATLPAGFDPWFSQATALAPEDRFATASELVESLAAVLSAAPPRSRVPTAEGSPARSPLASTAPALLPLPAPARSAPERRRRGPVLVAMALVLGGVVTIGVSVTGLARKAPSAASPVSVAPPDPAAAPRRGSIPPAAPTATQADACPSERADREWAPPGMVGGMAHAAVSTGVRSGATPSAPRPRGAAIGASSPSSPSPPPTSPPSTVSIGASAASPKSAPAPPPPYDPADRP
jgi:eukaryotic-like serine/threonine-protein kinase